MSRATAKLKAAAIGAFHMGQPACEIYGFRCASFGRTLNQAEETYRVETFELLFVRVPQEQKVRPWA